MKRIIAIAMALVLCILFVSACSDDDQTIDPVATTNPIESITQSTEPATTEPPATEPTTQPTEPATQPTEPATQPTEPATQPETPVSERRLTVHAPATWTEVYIYTWEPEVFGSFPGSLMSKSCASEFRIQIQDYVLNLVLTGKKADGTLQQTSDIKLMTNDSEVVIAVAEDASYELTYPEVFDTNRFKVINKPHASKTTGTASAYRVAGSGELDSVGRELYDGAWLGNWDPSNDMGLMYEVESGLYRKNYENVQPGTYEFKITKDGKWDVSYGPTSARAVNCTFTVNVPCTVTVDFTLKNDIGCIVVYGDGVEATRELIADNVSRFKASNAPAATKVDGPASVYRVVGDANWLGKWDCAFEQGVMNEVEPGLFRKNFENVPPGTYEFKITKDGKWDVSYGCDEKGSNCLFIVNSPCTITVDLIIQGDIGYISVYGQSFYSSDDI